MKNFLLDISPFLVVGLFFIIVISVISFLFGVDPFFFIIVSALIIGFMSRFLSIVGKTLVNRFGQE